MHRRLDLIIIVNRPPLLDPRCVIVFDERGSYMCVVDSILQTASSDEGLADGVRVAVGRRTPVLEVALLRLGDASRNANARAAVGDPYKRLEFR
jgi:hypothetical protein